MGNSLTKLLIASAAVTALGSAIEPGLVRSRFRLKYNEWGLLGPAGSISSDAELLAFVDGLENPKVVTYLKLSNGVFTNFALLARLTGLDRLHLSGCRISDLSPIAGLRNLDRLSLRNTDISDVSPLKGLTQMLRLDLSDTQVSDISALQSLRYLNMLDISNTLVSNIDALKAAVQSGALQELYLLGTQIEEFPDWAAKFQRNYVRVTLQSLTGVTVHMLYHWHTPVSWMSDRVSTLLGAVDATPRYILDGTVVDDKKSLGDLGAREGGELTLKVVFRARGI